MISDAMWEEAKQREAEKDDEDDDDDDDDDEEQAAYWAACCIQIDAVHKLITDDEGARLSWYHLVDSCVPADAIGPWNAQRPSRYHPWLYAPSVLERFLENLRAEEDVEEVAPAASADAQDDEGDSDQRSGAENLPPGPSYTLPPQPQLVPPPLVPFGGSEAKAASAEEVSSAGAEEDVEEV